VLKRIVNYKKTKVNNRKRLLTKKKQKTGNYAETLGFGGGFTEHSYWFRVGFFYSLTIALSAFNIMRISLEFC